jgi:hypothetical protein
MTCENILLASQGSPNDKSKPFRSNFYWPTFLAESTAKALAGPVIPSIFSRSLSVCRIPAGSGLPIAGFC